VKEDSLLVGAIAYSLPKTIIDVKVGFDVYVLPKDAAGAEWRAMLLPSTGTDAVTVTIKTVADANMRFILTPKTSGWTDTTVKIGLDANGCLTSCNGDFQDKTGTAIVQGIGALASVASLVKSADPKIAWKKTDVHFDVHRTIDAAILLAAGSGGEPDFLKGEAMNDCLSTSNPLLLAAFGKYAFEPPAGGHDYPHCQVSLTAQSSAVLAQDAVTLVAQIANKLSNKNTIGEVPGIIFHLANPGTLTVGFTKNIDKQIAIDVADTAPVGFIELRGHVFTSRGDTINLNDAGALKEYDLSAKSIVEAVATTAKSAIDPVVNDIKAYELARDKAAADALNRERQLAGDTILMESLNVQITAAQAAYDSAAAADKPAKFTALQTLRQQKAQLEVTIRALQTGVLLP
jgi:hypothetical protein